VSDPSGARPSDTRGLASAPCWSLSLTWSMLGVARTPNVHDEAMASGFGAQILGRGDTGAEPSGA